jgi:hypothetical protein
LRAIEPSDLAQDAHQFDLRARLGLGEYAPQLQSGGVVHHAKIASGLCQRAPAHKLPGDAYLGWRQSYCRCSK